MVEHLKIKTGPSQFSVINETNISEPALISIESSISV